MQLSRLKPITLKSSIQQKQKNGTYITIYKDIKEYKVQKQSLIDEISATIYGANVSKMYRISSPLQDLESFLNEKVNESEDNTSKYFIFIDNTTYKIVSVKETWIDIERI